MLVYYLSLLETEAEKEKFKLIYQEYRKRMKSYAMRFLKNEEDAEDALQDSFEKLIRVLDRIKDPISDDTAALLTVILKNTCLDILRRRGLKEMVALESVDPRQIATHSDMLEDMNVRMILQAIERLPQECCEILLMNCYFDLPIKKIAAILGLSLQGTYKRLNRAKGLLEKELEKEEVSI